MPYVIIMSSPSLNTIKTTNKLNITYKALSTSSIELLSKQLPATFQYNGSHAAEEDAIVHVGQ